jgi:hypothetical protein
MQEWRIDSAYIRMADTGSGWQTKNRPVHKRGRSRRQSGLQNMVGQTKQRPENREA